jgi:hypothetical protein
MITTIQQIQRAYLYKKGVVKTLNESEKYLTTILTEESLKDLYYEKTENLKPEIVNQTITHLSTIIEKKKGEEYDNLRKEFETILDGWQLTESNNINLAKLSQEDLRLFYKDLINFANKNKFKLPLNEINVNLIENYSKEEDI